MSHVHTNAVATKICGTVTLFFIKFRWDDQKRHSIESGIEAEGIVSRFD